MEYIQLCISDVLMDPCHPFFGMYDEFLVYVYFISTYGVMSFTKKIVW